jgi:cell wall-associated NlpC family hydrolase
MSTILLSPFFAISTIITTATVPIPTVPAQPEVPTVDTNVIYQTTEDDAQTYNVSSKVVEEDTSRDSYTIKEAPKPKPVAATPTAVSSKTTSIPIQNPALTQPVAQSSTAKNSVAASASGTTKERIVQLALQYKGVPYVFGGETPSGWDCSGYVKWVTANVTGINFNHGVSAEAHSQYTHEVARAAAQPGDFVVFSGTGGSEYHIGIYLGNGRMVHAPKPGDVTKESIIDWPGSSVRFYSLNG